MKPSTQVAALWQRSKKIGFVLVLSSVLKLLMLITGAVGFLPTASAPFTGLMAATNGNIHVGGSEHALSSQVAAEGDIRIGS